MSTGIYTNEAHDEVVALLRKYGLYVNGVQALTSISTSEFVKMDLRIEAIYIPVSPPKPVMPYYEQRARYRLYVPKFPDAEPDDMAVLAEDNADEYDEMDDDYAETFHDWTFLMADFHSGE